jgi:hypothetical protein
MGYTDMGYKTIKLSRRYFWTGPLLHFAERGRRRAVCGTRPAALRAITHKREWTQCKTCLRVLRSRDARAWN